jgi:hypothetical protein
MKINKLAIFSVMVPLLFIAIQFSSVAVAVTCTGNFTEYAGVCFPSNTNLSDQGVDVIIKNLMLWLLGIFGFIAIMGFVVSGVQYLTSAGDEEAVKKAKTNMKWCIIGVVVALSGFVAIKAIDAALRGTNNQF